jgi:hypothetical protein
MEVGGKTDGTGFERVRKARDMEGVCVVISSNHTVKKHLTSSLCGSKPLGLLSSVTGQSDEARDTQPRNIISQLMGLKKLDPLTLAWECSYIYL